MAIRCTCVYYASDDCTICHGSSEPITNTALLSCVVANTAFAGRV